jgi:hypothetical protein
VDQQRVPNTAAPHFLQEYTINYHAKGGSALMCRQWPVLTLTPTRSVACQSFQGERAPEEVVYVAEFYSIL